MLSNMENLRKYAALANNANDVLRKNKMCSECGNAIEGFTKDTLPKYTITCGITGEDRKGKCGRNCPNWK